MTSAADDIATILGADSSLALTLGTDLFVSEIPDGADVSDLCVGVFDSGGYSPQPNFVYERPSVTIRIRGAKGKYLEAYDLGEAIVNRLNGAADETIGGTRYIGIWQEGYINFLGYDASQRPDFSMNFRMHRTTST